MTMPIELPDEVARRVLAVPTARGIRPEQVVIEAVQAEVGSANQASTTTPFSSVQDELRQIAFDPRSGRRSTPRQTTPISPLIDPSWSSSTTT
jgi:hypothetical protein